MSDNIHVTYNMSCTPRGYSETTDMFLSVFRRTQREHAWKLGEHAKPCTWAHDGGHTTMLPIMLMQLYFTQCFYMIVLSFCHIRRVMFVMTNMYPLRLTLRYCVYCKLQTDVLTTAPTTVTQKIALSQINYKCIFIFFLLQNKTLSLAEVHLP